MTKQLVPGDVVSIRRSTDLSSPGLNSLSCKNGLGLIVAVITHDVERAGLPHLTWLYVLWSGPNPGMRLQWVNKSSPMGSAFEKVNDL